MQMIVPNNCILRKTSCGQHITIDMFQEGLCIKKNEYMKFNTVCKCECFFFMNAFYDRTPMFERLIDILYNIFSFKSWNRII